RPSCFLHVTRGARRSLPGLRFRMIAHRRKFTELDHSARPNEDDKAAWSLHHLPPAFCERRPRMATRLLLGTAFLLSTLLITTGCQSSGMSNYARADGDSGGVGLPSTDRTEGGMLLRTGSIMLGPGVGRNQWRWLGDGEWGF